MKLSLSETFSYWLQSYRCLIVITLLPTSLQVGLRVPPTCLTTEWRLTCHGVGCRRAGGGAGGADHAGVTAAGPADAAGAGAAVAAPLPALPGAAGSLPGAVLFDVVAHLMT